MQRRICMKGCLAEIAEMRPVRLCPIALVLMISGCAGPMGTIHGETAKSSVTSFDGSYQTTIHITNIAPEAKGSNWCETPGQPTITVTNGQFSYAVPHPNVPANITPIFSATMAPNGSFLGQTVDGTISGQVHGTHMEGSIDGQGCGYGFAGDRT
jgi:hypothetical protein